MQLVERGELDLDIAVSQYVTDFRPANPFGEEITLRQLMSHRGGLVREPSVGNYFDDSAPSLAETVASLNTTQLVFAPAAKTKYSNAGIAVVGYVLEYVKGKPFAQHLKSAVLDPMGLAVSAFETPEQISQTSSLQNRSQKPRTAHGAGVPVGWRSTSQSVIFMVTRSGAWKYFYPVVSPNGAIRLLWR